MRGAGLPVSLALLLLPGCKRTESASDAQPVTEVASARAEPRGGPDLQALLLAADLRVEARRGVAESLDALPLPVRAVLDAHHGGRVPYPLAAQVVSVVPARRAVLFQATRGEARPLVTVLEPTGEIAWTKSNPMGGVKPGATEAAIASGPGGHVALAWCNPTSGSVALRQWAEDGGAFADYEAARFESCEALSILYWPKKGWLLAIASRAGLVLQRIAEDGARAWGEGGVTLPWTFRAAAPASLALDTEESFMLFRLGQSGGPASPEFVFVSRHGPDGQPIWPATLSVKRLDAPSRSVAPRLVLSPGPGGSVRARLPGAGAGAGAGGSAGDVVVEVASDGVVTHP